MVEKSYSAETSLSPPRPASTFKVSVASEVVAKSILRMLRIESGSLYSWIQLENDRFHSFTSAKDDTEILLLGISSRGFCKPANSKGGCKWLLAIFIAVLSCAVRNQPFV